MPSLPGSNASHDATAYRLLLSLFVFLFCGFVALAAWQVERRTWKHALIARVDQRAHAAPMETPGRSRWAAINEADDAYRHVRASGIYLTDRQTFVRAVTVFGSGYWTITPLRRTDGSVILVNRGFVSGDQRAGLVGRAGVDSGPIVVTGLLRVSEPRGRFLRSNDPAADRWVSRDVAAIASRRGLGDVAPYYIDADADHDGIAAAAARGGPVGGLTVIAFTDNHLLYAVVWSTLALMSAGAAGYLVTRRR